CPMVLKRLDTSPSYRVACTPKISSEPVIKSTYEHTRQHVAAARSDPTGADPPNRQGAQHSLLRCRSPLAGVRMQMVECCFHDRCHLDADDTIAFGRPVLMVCEEVTIVARQRAQHVGAQTMREEGTIEIEGRMGDRPQLHHDHLATALSRRGHQS